MNILYVTPVMKIGGEELSTLSLTREMLRRGHEVTLKGNDGPMTPEFRKTGARVHVSPRPFKRSPAGLLADARDIRALIKRHQIDIVHVQSVLPAISCAMAIRSLRGKMRTRLIFHERGISPLGYVVVPKAFNFLVDRVIANSDHERELLTRNGLKVPCLRIHNCNNSPLPAAVSDDIRGELKIAKDAFVVGIIGRIAPEKGHLLLLDAFKRVVTAAGERRVVLMVVGDGDLCETVRAKTQELSLENSVVFTGFRRDLQRIYPALDVLAVPSSFETFGNVAVEASSWGVPVIASNVGGLPEALMYGESGILVPSGNVERLAEALQRLLDNPGEGRRLGLRGRELASTYFTPERVADEVEHVYRDVMQDRSNP